MSEEIILVEKDMRGVALVTLNRPDVRNAFNAELISAITDTITELNNDTDVRVIVLTGKGKAFSAGADLNMMSQVASFTEEENVAEGKRLAKMLSTLYSSPKPIIAKVNGPALGGGVGLVSASNIAIAADTAFFALSEVRLGITPATISPFVLQAISPRQAGRFFLTGERFGADKAKEIGLLHEIVAADALDDAVEEVIQNLLACSPNAQKEAQSLIHDFVGQPVSQALMDDAAGRIARVRASDEGKEGLTAFLEKRRPNWTVN